MEQRQYLIDTNAVIDYLGLKLQPVAMNFINRVVDDIPNISVVTKIEVLGFNTADEHYALLVAFINDAVVFGLPDEVVETTIELRKNYKTKLPDAIIAATALCYNFTVITRNTRDFKNIQGIQVINPHEL